MRFFLNYMDFNWIVHLSIKNLANICNKQNLEFIISISFNLIVYYILNAVPFLLIIYEHNMSFIY